MKKQNVNYLVLIAFIISGCGGGSGGTNSTVTDVAKYIENKPFYRVKTSDERYLKEI